MPALPGRDNGLFAQAYTPLRELEPRLTDAVLRFLKEQGVAAYAEAKRGPREHADRLWVDSAAEVRARELLDTHLAALAAELDAAEEAAWAQILAAYEAPSVEPAVRPEHPDLDDGRTVRQRPRPEPADDDWGVGAAPAETGQPDDREDDEHFEPPPPPPLPHADSVTRVAWIGLIGGPLYLVVALVLNLQIGGLPALLAVGAFVAGFVTLIARMPDHHDDDEDDGGAVV